ncbi:hypothetical protein ACX1N5_01790 [Acinetobacter sp. ANC 4636]
MKAMIMKIGKVIFVCQECEATWFSADEIKERGFVDFGTYMEEIGLEPLWDELEVEKM